MYKKGGKGINIDANPDLIELFKKERKRDININAGIGKESSVASFYVLEDSTLSSFSKEEISILIAEHGHELKYEVKVPILTIHDILQRHWNNQYPDFLNIDVEGTDLEIFQSMDFSLSKPKIICAETAEYSPSGNGRKRTDLITLIKNKGYIVFADTYINTIFVESDWFST